MKTKQGSVLTAIVILLIGLEFSLCAQTETQPDQASASLQPLDPLSVPPVGTFYFLSDYLKDGQSPPPYPFNPKFQDPFSVYSLGDDSVFLVDDSSLQSDSEVIAILQQLADDLSSPMMANSMESSGSLDPAEADGSGGGGDSGGPMGPFDASSFGTNLWIEVPPTNTLAIAGQFSVNLRNTIETQLYDVLTSSNISLPLASWSVEQSLLGATGDTTPTQLLMSGRTNLFVSARFAGDSSGVAIPDWWQQQASGGR